MRTPLVSVIIPNFNYARFLSAAIASVLKQTYPLIEILVVDDGSTDTSREVLSEFGPKIRVFYQQRMGVSCARNLGIEKAKGNTIAFLDSDDRWDPNKVARQIHMLENHRLGMVYCQLKRIDQMGRPIGLAPLGAQGRVLMDMVRLRGPGIPASGSSALIRRECFDKVGLFDPRLSTSADWDMWRRIACHFSVGCVPEALVEYRVHPSSMHHNLPVFEHDMLLALQKTFEDPDAREAHPLRREAYGNLFLMFAGSHLRGGSFFRAVYWAARAIWIFPPSIKYILGLPARAFSRILHRVTALAH